MSYSVFDFFPYVVVFGPCARIVSYRSVILARIVYCLCLCMCVCVCLFVCLFVCTVTDFSAEDEASGVKFCTAVHRRPRQEISLFVNFAPPEAPNRTNRPARGPRTPLQYIARSRIGMCGYRSVPINVLVITLIVCQIIRANLGIFGEIRQTLLQLCFQIKL